MTAGTATTRRRHFQRNHRAPQPVRVEVRGLTKSFGAVRAVSDLGLHRRARSVTGFLGPNGAGKTTTLRMVLGLISPDAGTATFNGAPYAALPDPSRTVGAVLETAFHPARSGPQPPAGLLPRRRAAARPRRRGARPGRAWPTPAAAAPAATPSACGSGWPWPTRCSATPRVLVLDEPANGLDPEGIQWLRGFLRHLAHEQGRTVLVSSHLLSEVEQTVDRVVIVGAGRLVREGSMAELRSGADGAGTVLVRSPEAPRLAERAARRRAHGGARRRGALTVTGRTPAEIGRRAFAAGIELHELRAHTSGLEEIYFQLTAGQEQFAAPAPGAPIAEGAAR